MCTSWAQPLSCKQCHLWHQYKSLMLTCPWQTRCEFSASLWIFAWLSITTRQPYRDRAITMQVRSATYAIYWRWTYHRRLHAAWLSRKSTIAILCSTALHPAPLRSSIKSRTTQRVSFYKRLDGQTSTRCFRRCTACLLNSASTTSWPCWRSRLSRRYLRSIWASTSRWAPAHATLDRRPSHCCACHFDGHHLPDDRSALPHLWLGTHCYLLC